jgi:cell division protein FtsB
MIRVIGGAVMLVVIVGVLTLFVFPTRTYLAQRHQLAVESAQLKILSTQNSQMTAEAAKLQTDAEIERIARAQYHLVRPGEQAFVILPPAASAASPSPSTRDHSSAHRGIIAGVWHGLTSWI